MRYDQLFQYFFIVILPTIARYLQLDVNKVESANKKEAWDRGVTEASEEYKMRMVNNNLHKYYVNKGLQF